MQHAGYPVQVLYRTLEAVRPKFKCRVKVQAQAGPSDRMPVGVQFWSSQRLNSTQLNSTQSSQSQVNWPGGGGSSSSKYYVRRLLLQRQYHLNSPAGSNPIWARRIVSYVWQGSIRCTASETI